MVHYPGYYKLRITKRKKLNYNIKKLRLLQDKKILLTVIYINIKFMVHYPR